MAGHATTNGNHGLARKQANHIGAQCDNGMTPIRSQLKIPNTATRSAKMGRNVKFLVHSKSLHNKGVIFNYFD